MLIEEGYWNYYLAFRIENYKKHVEGMTNEKLCSGMIAVVTDGDTFVNKNVKSLLEEREDIIRKCKAELSGKESVEKLQEMYMQDKLPEYFFDFDFLMRDLLKVQIEDSIENVRFVNDGYRQLLHSFGEGKCSYYVLMPLKVYFSEWEFVYCPVYIQLLTSGHGIIKLQIPITNVQTEAFAVSPLKRWFSHIKVWEHLYNKNGEDSYKILSSDIEGIEDVTFALIGYVQNFFSESIIDKKRFLGLETFVVSKSSNPEMVKLNQGESVELKDMYHFVFPENFAMNPSEEELIKFWEKRHFDASGIQVFMGDRGRLVMYADVKEMLERSGREALGTDNDYLQASIAATFDPFILLALAQKDNEISIYRIAELDRHTINKKMIQYYTNINYLEGMLLDAPKHGVIFYNKVREMLDHCMMNFQEMLCRMQKIEEYEKLRLNEKQSTLINRFTLIFSVLFGLPLIQETLTALKNIIGIKTEIFPIITIGHISLAIWLILLYVLIIDNIDSYLEYEGIVIEENLHMLSRLKKVLFIVIAGVINKGTIANRIRQKKRNR